MTANSLEISLRAVMDYVAGRIDRHEFEITVNPGCLETLKARLEQGRSIESVHLQRTEGGDDDGLEIQFGEHDAAIAPFRVPKGGDRK